jgi:hypothetical protein
MWRIFTGILLWGLVIAGQAFAQKDPQNSRKKTIHEEAPTVNAAEFPIFLFPDFFHYKPVVKGDTSWSYECYNRNMHKINMYELKNVDEIDHIEYFKSYKQPTPEAGNSLNTPTLCIYELVYKYVQPDTNLWMRVNPKINEIRRYEIYKDRIVRTDTVKLFHPVTKKPQSVVYQYFKTEMVTADKVQSNSK